MNFPLLHATVTSSHMSLCTVAGTPKYLRAHKPRARNKTIPQPVFKNSIHRAATVPNNVRISYRREPPAASSRKSLQSARYIPANRVISRLTRPRGRVIQIRNRVVVAKEISRSPINDHGENFSSRTAFERVTYQRISP